MGDGDEDILNTSGGGSADPVAAVREGWRVSWQAPAFLLATALLLAGLGYVIATRPSPDFGGYLDRAEQLIGYERYEDSIQLMNQRIFPYIQAGSGLPQTHRTRYHRLLARAIYLGQRKLAVNDERNNLAIIREYLEAERQGAALSPREQYQLADSYVSRGQWERALRRAGMVPQASRDLRDRLHQRVVGIWLGSRTPRYAEVLELLASLLADPNLPADVRVWALERQAEVRLAQGDYDEAITRLLRAVPRLQDPEPAQLGLLHLMLGRAYYHTDAVEEAARRLDQALRLMPEGEMRRGVAKLYQARLRERAGDYVEARDLYSEIVDRFVNSTAYLPALMGLGQIDAAMRDVPLSLQHYGKLVYELGVRGFSPELRRSVVTDSLLARVREQFSIKEYEAALSYAALARDLYEQDQVPAEIIEGLAQSHRAMAEQLMGAEQDRQFETLRDLDAASRAEAQRHMIRAAMYYRMHADKFVLTDNDRYADSLWEAARHFDRGGDQEEAIAAYQAFAVGVPGDPRQVEARYRLGQSYRAIGDHAAAAARYGSLIEDMQSGVADVGPWAIRSYVPLAQAYLSDADGENDAEAEKLLLAAVSGQIGLTGTPEFHDALIALAAMYYTSARYAPAIERYREAIARFPGDPEIEALRFHLADSHRLIADQIEDELRGEMPENERRDLEQRVVDHRAAALAMFEEVRNAFEDRDSRRLGSTAEIYLRNSYFYMGDCAFDLGEFDTAIRHYDTAKDRYPDDPASLVAMVQIVNAYVEMGDYRRARTANERARTRFLAMPDSVWDDPALPMGRDDWERWLESSSLLYEVADPNR